MRFQAKLTTKLEEFSINDAIVELSNNVDAVELNDIVINFLKQLDKYDEKQLQGRSFDFFIGDRLLRLNAEEHFKLYEDEIDVNEILNEKTVDIQYQFAIEPPKPLDAIKHNDWVSCVDANDTYAITGSYDNSIRIFYLKNRTLVKTIETAHEQPIVKVRFVTLLDQKDENEIYFLSCGHDEVSILRKLNIKTNKVSVVYTYHGHNRSVNCIDFRDELIATGSFDKTLRLFSASKEDDDAHIGKDGEIETNVSKKHKVSEKSVGHTSRCAIMTLTGHGESITGVRWLSSGKEVNTIASCSMDCSICFWDVEVGENKNRLLSNKPLLGLDYSESLHLLITASCDRFVRTWDERAPANANAKAAYTSHTAWVSSVAFDKTSSYHFISGGYDNVVKLWDLRSPKACLYDLIGHHDKVLDVNWTNPAYILSSSADSSLKVFSTEDKIK